MTKIKTKYSDKFQKVYDDGNKQIYIRNFGHVILDNDKKVDLLVIAEIYDLLNSGAVREDELPAETPVQMTFNILPELKLVNAKTKKSIEQSSGCGPNFKATLVDVYEYIGGLRFEPSNIVWFKTNEEALEHLLSKELNAQISVMGMMSGFTMDMHYNRIGETNWDILNKIMNER